MNSLHPIIYIFLIVFFSLIANNCLNIVALEKNKTNTNMCLLSGISFGLTIYLSYLLFSHPYPSRYDRLWGVMSFIVFTLYGVISSDSQITKKEVLGLITTIYGMIIIYKEQ